MSKTEKVGKHNVEIKTSSDFENDPQGAMDALEQTGFAVFMITKYWYDDKRAQKEWRFAKDMKKPMIYIISQNAIPLHPEFFTESLIGTINDYGDTEKTATFLQAMMAAYEKNLNKK